MGWFCCRDDISTTVGAAAETKQQTGTGLVIYDCELRRRWMRKQNPAFDLFEPLSQLPVEQQVKVEDGNIAECIRYAKEVLSL